ncbi:MAG: F0F1 ATP synthase subunit delta [Clostridia bacterium]|nr:F0F1 ATP synthase subunit delta [Clostridia bacterium]
MISTSNDFAAALFMLAMEEDKLDVILSDLLKVKDAFDDNPDYILLLSSPGIPKRERLAAIDSSFGESLSEYTVNFLKVLCEHGKMTEIGECIKIFRELKKQAENRVTARVRSAVALDDAQTSRLKEILEKKLGSQVKIKQIIDKSMLGGVKIEFEDKIIDGSIQRQLHDIKEVISG